MNRFFTLLFAASCLTAVGQVGSQSCSTSTMISVTSEHGDSVFVGEQVSFQMIGFGPLFSVSCGVSGWSNPESVTVISNDCYSFTLNHSIHQTVIFNEPGTFWINGTMMNNPFDVYYCSISITISEVEGCTSLDFVEFNPLATIDDGSCLTAIVYGCTNLNACNYDSGASVEDESCLTLDDCGVCGGDNSSCYGCTDVEACNYEETATQDDGSCVYNDDCGVCGGDNSCFGCTHENAMNYDSTATIEDGSCLYNQEAHDAEYNAGYEAGSASVQCPPCANSDCPGDFTADGYIGVDDILSMLSLYDTSCSE